MVRVTISSLRFMERAHLTLVSFLALSLSRLEDNDHLKIMARWRNNTETSKTFLKTPIPNYNFETSGRNQNEAYVRDKERLQLSAHAQKFFLHGRMVLDLVRKMGKGAQRNEAKEQNFHWWLKNKTHDGNS